MGGIPDIEFVEPTIAELQAQLVETRARMTEYRNVLDSLIDALLMVRDQQLTVNQFLEHVVDTLDNDA